MNWPMSKLNGGDTRNLSEQNKGKEQHLTLRNCIFFIPSIVVKSTFGP